MQAPSTGMRTRQLTVALRLHLQRLAERSHFHLTQQSRSNAGSPTAPIGTLTFRRFELLNGHAHGDFLAAGSRAFWPFDVLELERLELFETGHPSSLISKSG